MQVRNHGLVACPRSPLTCISRQKLKKLKAAAKSQFGEPTAGADGEALPKTPAKRGKKAAGETPAKSTGKRKSKKDKDDEEAKSEEPNEDESPAKKLKIENGGDSED